MKKRPDKGEDERVGGLLKFVAITLPPREGEDQIIIKVSGEIHLPLLWNRQRDHARRIGRKRREKNRSRKGEDGSTISILVLMGRCLSGAIRKYRSPGGRRLFRRYPYRAAE